MDPPNRPAGPLTDKRLTLVLDWGSSLLFANHTLKEREKKEKPGCPSLNRDVSSGRRDCAAAFLQGVVDSIQIV